MAQKLLLGGQGGHGHRRRSGGADQRSSCFAAVAVVLVEEHAHSPGIPEAFLEGPHEAVEYGDGVGRIDIDQMLGQEVRTFFFPVLDCIVSVFANFVFDQFDRFLVEGEELWETEKAY